MQSSGTRDEVHGDYLEKGELRVVDDHAHVPLLEDSLIMDLVVCLKTLVFPPREYRVSSARVPRERRASTA